MSISIIPLGSGSAGNAILVHNARHGILVDAGFSRKEIVARLQSVGFPESRLSGILITHEHQDHVQGLRVLADALGIPAYASVGTMSQLKKTGKAPERCVAFEPGSTFDVGGFSVRPFAVSHDAMDPVGFILSRNGFRVGVAMDLGAIDRLAASHLRGCDAMVLESNHDLRMLRTSKRPMRLIHRIAGRSGHLSNDAVAEALPALLTEKTRHLMLGHISFECNTAELVQSTASAKLKQMSRDDIFLSLLSQDEPGQPVCLGG